MIVSSTAYNTARRDVLIMAITSQTGRGSAFGECLVVDWKQSGLLFPSVIKPVMATVEAALIPRALGSLSARDQASLKTVIGQMIG